MTKKLLITLLLCSTAFATVTGTDTDNIYTGDGGTVAFAFNFGVFSTSEVVVDLITTATGVPVTKAITTHYTVSAPNNNYWTGPGGTVTMVTAPALTEKLYIRRVPPLTQDFDLSAKSTFQTVSTLTFENVLDKIVTMIQYINYKSGLALKIPANESGLTVELPNAVDRANEFISFDASGNVQTSDGSSALIPGTLTDGGVLLGSGTGEVTAMAVLGDGEMIVGDGTTDPVAESGATLRTSIGVGTTDSPQFAGLNLGHATANTLTASGGVLSVEGVQVASGTPTDGYNLVGDGTNWQVQAKPVFDIRDYGAVCNGNTNDAAAVQAAMTAAGANGGTVLITGSCGIGSSAWTGLVLTSKNDVTIMGTGHKSGFVLQAAPTQTLTNLLEKIVFKFDTCSRLIIQNLTLDVNNIASTSAIGFDSVTYSSIRNCRLINCVTEGVVVTETSSYNKYINNEIISCNGGINVGHSVDGTSEKYSLISNNIVRSDSTGGTHALGGYLEYGTISNNVLEGPEGVGIYLGSNGGGTQEASAYCIITGNVIYGAGLSGIELLVSTDGVHIGHVIANNVVCGSGASGYLMYQLQDCVVTGNLAVNNATLGGTESGFDITTITTTGTPIKNVIISNNTAYDNRSGASRTQNNGIHFNGKTFACENIKIEGNLCRNNLADGILVTTGGSSSLLSVKDNTATDNVSEGINIQGSWTESAVQNNIVTGNANPDLWIVGTANGVRVSGNVTGITYIGRPQDVEETRPNFVTTTDATVTSTWTFDLTDNSAVWVTANVLAIKNDGSDRAAYTLQTLAYRDGAGAVIEGGATTKIESDATWNVDFDVYVNSVRVRVTGKAGTNINWKTQINMINAN